MGQDFGGGFFRRDAVEVQDGDGVSAVVLTTQRHVRDIHSVVAADGSNKTDQAGLVFVAEDQQLAVQVSIQVEAVEPDQSEESVAEDRAGDAELAVVGDQRRADERGEVAAFARG